MKEYLEEKLAKAKERMNEITTAVGNHKIVLEKLVADGQIVIGQIQALEESLKYYSGGIEDDPENKSEQRTDINKG